MTNDEPHGDEELRERIRQAIGYAWSESMVDAFADAVMAELGDLKEETS